MLQSLLKLSTLTGVRVDLVIRLKDQEPLSAILCTSDAITYSTGSTGTERCCKGGGEELIVFLAVAKGISPIYESIGFQVVQNGCLGGW